MSKQATGVWWEEQTDDVELRDHSGGMQKVGGPLVGERETLGDLGLGGAGSSIRVHDTLPPSVFSNI